jgi:four helix bundle protein
MKFDLDERLINYSVLILEIVDSLPDNKGANHLANQIVRSGTAPSLMYGEAQSSESRKDFIHKMRLPLKELRETHNCLKILSRMRYQGALNERFAQAVKESQELIAIFAKSIDTAIKNSKPKV